MFREDDCQAMKFLIEEDRENNILNALGLFDKKKLIHVQQKLSVEPKKTILPQKRRSQLLGIPISVSKSKASGRRSSVKHTKASEEFDSNASNKFSKTRAFQSAARIPKVRTRKKHTKNSYGSIKGVLIGDKWDTRVECSNAGVHKPTVAAIHAGKEGAYSIAISGDYEDDQDNGYCFTYTGSGGRDITGARVTERNLRTVPQSRDQSLDGANTSLIRSIETRKPVRVIRGYNLDSPFAPETGYRYDGLYTVEKFWTCAGKSGFLVYKFLMKRCLHQQPAPWHKTEPIKIVKIRKRKQQNTRNTVLNFSGKLTMNEENGDKITTCEVSQMQLQLSTDIMSDSVTINSSAVFSNRDCEVQLDPDETPPYQRPTVSEDENGEKSLTDDSNKENSNKVIIKTRWRRSRLSLPSLTSDSSSPQSSNEADSRVRQCRKRSYCSERRNIKKPQTNQGEKKTPPKIAYFNISNDPSFKWSLFASQEEIKIFKKYFRKNTNYNHAADFEGEFKGFESQDSLNKVMILGFIINDIEMKQRMRDAD